MRGVITAEQRLEMTLEDRVKFLEKKLEQLWTVCKGFRVEIDNCEGGCCPTYADMDLPDWEDDPNGKG